MKIGIDIKYPKGKCKDKKCPFHSDLKLHGRIFNGTVISAKAQATATIVWERQFYLKKYERYEKRRTKVQAHIPGCIKVKEGDTVKIMESRPLSKTKHFVIIENASS